ncbi:MAG TPA: hypothetical protein PLY70_01005 [Saprospiraceae bacterium]|nr:hypothetical protein [Saprospiraceae bacterium]HPN69449.1 hypothetical protein [Saprospiraceae bacterium]
MVRKVYQVSVAAPKEKCADLMLGLTDKSTYEAWTAEFNPTSTFDGSWDLGSKIKFVGVDENGNKAGMLGRIVAHEPAKFVSIQHYGLVEGEQEITEGPQVESWAGGHENYTFESDGQQTTITAEIDVTPEHLDYFDKTYPAALQKLKEIIEEN